MNTHETTIKNRQELQKYFASILRKRSKGELTNAQGIDVSIQKFFTRKELVAILNRKFDGKLPKEVDLVELENEDLLQLIEDDLFILSYLVPQWINQELEQQKVAVVSDSTNSNSNSNTESKKPEANASAQDKAKEKNDKKNGKETVGK